MAKAGWAKCSDLVGGSPSPSGLMQGLKLGAEKFIAVAVGIIFMGGEFDKDLLSATRTGDFVPVFA
jgi:hypothetical protein